jgi:hypothetical protein
VTSVTLCITYYALPIAVSIPCIYFTKFVISNDPWLLLISRVVTSTLLSLVIFHVFYQPNRPQWIVTLFQEHGWKRGVFLLIFPFVVAVLWVLSHLTISLLNCRISTDPECDFEFSRLVLVTWLFISLLQASILLIIRIL